jgi:hypothetical protein
MQCRETEIFRCAKWLLWAEKTTSYGILSGF